MIDKTSVMSVWLSHPLSSESVLKVEDTGVSAHSRTQKDGYGGACRGQVMGHRPTTMTWPAGHVMGTSHRRMSVPRRQGNEWSDKWRCVVAATLRPNAAFSPVCGTRPGWIGAAFDDVPRCVPRLLQRGVHRAADEGPAAAGHLVPLSRWPPCSPLRIGPVCSTTIASNPAARR